MLGRVSRWDKGQGRSSWTSSTQQISNLGNGLGWLRGVETTHTKARLKANVSNNRRWQTVKQEEMATELSLPSSHSFPKESQKPSKILLELTARGHTFIISLLVSCKSLLIGITFFHLASAQSVLLHSVAILFFLKKTWACYSFQQPPTVPPPGRGDSELRSITSRTVYALSPDLPVVYISCYFTTGIEKTVHGYKAYNQKISTQTT